MPEPDWMYLRTRVTTLGQLRQALNSFSEDLDLPILGFYDDGFGIAHDVSVGITESTKGEKFFAVDVRDDEGD